MTKNHALIIFTLIILAIVVVATLKQTPANQEATASGQTELSYESFHADLEEHCPYYEPNGARYRECLSDLLDERSKEVADLYGQILDGLDAQTDPEFQTARDEFKRHLQSLSFSWLSYSDYLCKAQADSFWGGSDQGGELTRCRLYETEKYRQMLEQFKSQWIR